MTFIHLVGFLGGLFCSLVLTRTVRNLAVRRTWVAAPESARHIHEVALPRIGGVAIFLSFSLVLALLLAADSLFHLYLDLPYDRLRAIFLPSVVILLLGLWDDLRSVSPYVKFSVQALAATLLFLGGLRIGQLPLLFGFETLGWFLSLPLTIFWVLLITNAFNLIDGLDGLAAGAALFATVTMFVIASTPVPPHAVASVLSILLAGSTLGFLRYNFHPATIFLGDSGSQFIGFMLSALALAGNQKSATVVAVAIPVVSFGLPILDTAVAVVRRFVSGQPVFRADREHIHHKLLERGLSQRQVVVLLYGVCAVFGILSLLLMNFGGKAIGAVLVVVGAIVWLVVQQLGYQEFFELKRIARRTVEQKQVMVNDLSIRRATERLAAISTWPGLRQVLGEAFESNDFDGYSLTIPADKFPDVSDGAAGLERENGKLLLSWSKQTNGGEALPVWRLTIDLVTDGGNPCGWFRVHRYYSQRPLLFDINLLTSNFPSALACAVERALEASQAPQHKPSTSAHRPPVGTPQPGVL